MAKTSSEYDYILEKINSFRNYPYFREKTDAYIFSALCIKSHFYKNPAILWKENDLEDMIVDGAYDGGVDILLADPSSESCDFVIGQSKFYKTISFDDSMNALIKMANFYKNMLNGHFENVSEKVRNRFLTLHSDVGEESKIIFILFTSAPRKKINIESLERRFKEQFSDAFNIELFIFFASDMVNEIKEAESRRPTVESGKIRIDKVENFLEYGNDAVIVNVSALSLKELYILNGTNLLARNLRYHITTERRIDKAIEETINSAPDMFWLKNNGITIICDSFDIDGKEVKLKNFSVINGGQTVYVLYKNKKIYTENDFYLPCKIICSHGNNEDEKNLYCLEIAKAVNSQKPIKLIDLKANSPEQVRFSQAMRDIGVFYKTKRGEAIPNEYKDKYKNTDIAEIGKLCLCAIFQVPGASRSQPSTLYKPKYYDVIFDNQKQAQIAKICGELLYIDYFFRNTFIKEYDRENRGKGKSAEDKISFVHNARTVCIAFVAFASRYRQGNLTDQSIDLMTSCSYTDLYDNFIELKGFNFVLPDVIFKQKDKYDEILKRLFNVIISSGIVTYNFAKSYDNSITATNFLKNDKNYYQILSAQQYHIKTEIKKIFDDIDATVRDLKSSSQL